MSLLPRTTLHSDSEQVGLQILSEIFARGLRIGCDIFAGGLQIPSEIFARGLRISCEIFAGGLQIPSEIFVRECEYFVRFLQ
jgi:hypothetical protein